MEEPPVLELAAFHNLQIQSMVRDKKNAFSGGNNAVDRENCSAMIDLRSSEVREPITGDPNVQGPTGRSPLAPR